MRDENPYRAAGTFAGDSYVERGADRALRAEIQTNTRYPYVVAARQSGKSSLLVRAMESLDPREFRAALVDLSPLTLSDYGEFWRRVLVQIARRARIEPTGIDPDQPDETFLLWLSRFPERLVVFVDEIDALLGASFRDLFFSKIRSLFNQRATERDLRRLQFVLAGAAHPMRLIQDHMRSPFNVGIEIELDDFSLEQIQALSSHLAGTGARVDAGVPERIRGYTGGSVYLCQALLERLFRDAAGCERIDEADVDRAADALVEGAPRDVHFKNIYELIGNSRRLLDNLACLQAGVEIPQPSAQDLRLTGLSNGVEPFRNELYRRVFGAGGPLDLLKLLSVPSIYLPAHSPSPLPSPKLSRSQLDLSPAMAVTPRDATTPPLPPIRRAGYGSPPPPSSRDTLASVELPAPDAALVGAGALQAASPAPQAAVLRAEQGGVMVGAKQAAVLRAEHGGVMVGAEQAAAVRAESTLTSGGAGSITARAMSGSAVVAERSHEPEQSHVPRRDAADRSSLPGRISSVSSPGWLGPPPDPPRGAPPVLLELSPRYPDEETRRLSEELFWARDRKKVLERTGLSTEGVDREILDLKRRLREGGQLRAGDALGDGRYLLLEQVGRGGFASVWKASDRELDAIVAVKVLLPDAAGNPTRRERFFGGARAMAALQHPAVVRVLSPYGEDGGYSYFTMEYLPGGDLRRAVLAGRFTQAELVRVMLGVGDALATAHARGLIHRDVKAANILLTEQGEPRLTDFDLLLDPETTAFTRTGGLGTFLFAAPEMFDRPHDVTPAADVFGLGMTMLFALSGRDLTPAALRSREQLIDDLPCSAAIKGVLRRATEWDPQDRFEDAAAFCRALESAVALADDPSAPRLPEDAARDRAERAGAAGPLAPQAPATKRVLPHDRGARWAMPVLLALIVLSAGLLVLSSYLLIRLRSASPPSAPITSGDRR